ncbi:DUF3857 domain-containing transglutaminase family protein [Shewanella halotolerans]|uniref:DUF3857 domain-containing transglutaminase family protein n=1 Tax=Shewanella halotolerans TaxID=2864204 RepID=UPI001C658C5F|nr:DUF3857 domain-containing protein [Shewanella halotolerans]QYJ88927.1 DUF3857 domain-containing protein [Shewanella halotolerans]
MKLIKLLIVCYLSLISLYGEAKTIKSGDYQIAIAPTSQWIIPQPLASIGLNKDKSPIHYRMVGRQERFTANSNEYYQDFAATALNQEGVKELSKIELTFNPEFEKLTLHTLEVERKSSWQDRLDSAKIDVIHQEQELSSDLFNGLATAVIVLKDVRVGDTVRYQYTIEGRNPVYGEEFGSTYPMGWEIAVDKLHLRIVNASDKPFYIQENKIGKPTTSDSVHGKVYEWNISNVSKYKYEEGIPTSYLWAPVIFVSSAGSWAEVNRWALAHYHFAEQRSKLLQDYIDEVTKAYSTKTEQIAEFIRFVQQDVRYFGIEIGQNSHIPHSPNTVFERRYGDCKDKASLLIALFDAIDVKSSPALVNSERGEALNERQASPMLFNHVINYFSYDGKPYFIDATNNHQAVGLNAITQPDFGFALVLDEKTQSLTAMPKADIRVDRVEIEQHYVSSNYESPVDLYITTKYLGHEADYMRYQLASVSHSEIEQHYLNYYAKFYRDIQLATPTQVTDIKDKSNELVLSEHYRIGDFWQPQNKTLNFGLFASYVKNYVELPKVIHRSQPLALPSMVTVEQTLKVSMPENIDYQISEQDKQISSKGIDYRSTEAYINGQFIRRHKLIIDEKTLSTKESKDFIDALREVDDDLYYSGGVTGDFSQPINPGIEYLQQQLGSEGAQ